MSSRVIPSHGRDGETALEITPPVRFRSAILASALGAAWLLTGACDGRPLSSLSGGAGGPGADGGADLPQDGRCGPTPRLLVSASTYPVPASSGGLAVNVGALRVNGAEVYYVIYIVQTDFPSMPYLAGSVMRVPAGGGQPTQVATGYVFEPPVFTPTSVILGEGNAYPNTGQMIIVSVPFDGGPPTTLATLTDGDSLLGDPVTDGTFVYFVDRGGVQAISLASASAGTAPMTLTSEVPSNIGIFATRLVMTFPQGSVESIPLPPGAAGMVTTLATGLPPGAKDLMSCGSNACWLAGDSALEELSPMGGPTTTIATLTGPLASVLNVVFDGTSFFVVGDADYPATTDNIETIPGNGGSPVVVVSTPSLGAGAIAVDDECVYWSSSKGIFSLAKTARGQRSQ